MEPFQLTCHQCQAAYETDSLRFGAPPPSCVQCGTELELANEVRLACLPCGLATDPMQVSLQETFACEVCGQTLSFLPVDLAPSSAQDSGAPPPPPTSPQLSQTNASAQTIPELAPQPERQQPRTASPSVSSGQTIPLLKNAIPSATLSRIQNSSVPDPSWNGKTLSSVNTVALSDKDKESVASRSRGGGIKNDFFGKYKIITEIARGGMGIVYRVHDPDLRRDLALKVLLQGEGADETAIKRFMREARAAANINHPNIIPVHEMGQIDGQYFFTMDFIEGKSFQDYIDGPPEERLPPELFIEKVRDVCLALQAAHEQCIIHRDLKPANIMLRGHDLEVVLMDFGLAKDNSSMSIMSMTGAVMGSPAYMSPEQAQGRTKEIDHRSDIYSLGIVLYEGLTGKQPFVGETIFDTLSRVVYQEPIPPRAIAPDAVPPSLQNIILKCMEKDPAKRYASMQDLASDLDAYLEGKRVSARPILAVVRTWRKIKRKPAALAAVIATPLVLAALAIAWFLFTRPSYVELAAQTLATGDEARRLGTVKELSSLLFEGKIKKADDKTQALALFRKCLEASTPPSIAAAAIETASRLADEQAITPLLELADNNLVDETVRRSAMTALAAIGAEKKVETPDIPLLLSRMASVKDSPLPVRLAAIDALRVMWGASAIPALADIAKDKEATTDLRVAALKAMTGHIVVESPRMSELIVLSADPDEKVAQAAMELAQNARPTNSVLSLYGYGSLGAKAYAGAAKVVKKVAENQRVAQKFMDEDMEIKTQEPAPKTSPVDAMLAKLADSAPDVRLAAAFDLGQLGDGKAVPELVKHIADPDNSVRGVAARAVVQLAPKAKPNMIDIRKLLENKDLLIREQAVFVIGELADAGSLKDLLKLAEQDTSRRVQAILAKAFQRIADPVSLPALKKMLDAAQDDSPSTATACLKAIASFEKAGAPTLIDLLESRNPKVRQTAALNLKEISGADYGEDKAKWEEWARKNPPK